MKEDKSNHERIGRHGREIAILQHSRPRMNRYVIFISGTPSILWLTFVDSPISLQDVISGSSCGITSQTKRSPQVLRKISPTLASLGGRSKTCSHGETSG
jgi:hypothetical protein